MEEALDVTKIYSVAGLLPPGVPVVARRPFRAPHTTSHTGLVGGGRFPRLGEISLAHRGVLFLDELPEFGQNALEMHPSEGRGLFFPPAHARQPRDRAGTVAQYATGEDDT